MHCFDFSSSFFSVLFSLWIYSCLHRINALQNQKRNEFLVYLLPLKLLYCLNVLNYIHIVQNLISVMTSSFLNIKIQFSPFVRTHWLMWTCISNEYIKFINEAYSKTISFSLEAWRGNMNATFDTIKMKMKVKMNERKNKFINSIS